VRSEVMNRKIITVLVTAFILAGVVSLRCEDVNGQCGIEKAL